MKVLFYKFLGLFGIHRQTDLQMLRNHLVNTRQEYEMRIQQLEHDVNRLNKMLAMHEVSIAVDDSVLIAHRDIIISKSVMNWLPNWVADHDFSESISEAIDDHDFSDSISDALDDAISNRDWDYELRGSIDWDKFAERVSEKLDWSTIISDNEIVCQGDYDFDDFMLKSDHLSEDDIVTRDELSDMVIGELKRDWFEQMMKEEVTRHFKDTLQKVRQNEEANCRNAIDDEIESKVALLIAEELQKKFGDSFDIWFHNLIAHSVKQVISDMIVAAHQQVVANQKGEDNV